MKKYILLILLLLCFLYYNFFLKEDYYFTETNNFTYEGLKNGGEEELNLELEKILQDIENYDFIFLLYSEIGGYDLRKIENKPELMLIHEEAKKDENILNILKEKANNSQNLEFKEFVDLIEYNLNLEK